MGSAGLSQKSGYLTEMLRMQEVSEVVVRSPHGEKHQSLQEKQWYDLSNTNIQCDDSEDESYF